MTAPPSVYGAAVGWAGRWDRDTGSERWDVIAFFRGVIDRIFRDLGYHPDAILAAWRERGWLDVREDDRRRFTKRMRIGIDADAEDSESAHLIAIRREAIEAADA